MKTPTSNTITASHRFHRLTVKIGNEFQIDLPSNRTTGHKWEADYDKSHMQLSSSTYNLVQGKTGGGGTESFIFTPSEKGVTLIRMLYKRPWETTKAKEAVYEVTIVD